MKSGSFPEIMWKTVMKTIMKTTMKTTTYLVSLPTALYERPDQSE